MSSLWRNREFTLLWTSQCLSDLGGAVATLAIPLLVLEMTDSAVMAGTVGTAAQFTKLLCRLPSGVLADRLNRRRALLTCDVIRLVAFVILAVAVATGRADLTTVVLVALIDAVCGSLFHTTEHAALRSIVPATQLPAAVARNEARTYGTSLAGPPLGGLLFGITPALPFIGNALSYLASLIGIAMIRKPLQAARPPRPIGHRSALLEGLRFVFGSPFLRSVLIIAAPLNFALYGSIFTIIVTLQSHDVPPGVIGLTETIVGAGGLIGALAASTLQRRISFAALIRALCWAATLFLTASALLTTSVAAAAPIALAIFVGPACNAALFGYQAAMTPDHLQGRVLSVIFLVAMSAASAAPVLAGVFVTAFSPTTSILLFATAVSTSALTATFAPAIRQVRPIEELAAA